MKLKGDYHMHSKYSGDCKNEMEDVVKQAISRGLTEIAITDHGPLHSGYGIKVTDYPQMHREILELREKYPQINILLGLEANLIGRNGKIDISEDMLAYCDWLNCGYHFGSNLGQDIGIHIQNVLSKFSKTLYQKAKRENTRAMVEAMRKNKIKMLTHPGAKAPIDIEEVAKVAAETGTMLEINNSHGHLTVETLKVAMAYDVTFVVNSDAHELENIGIVDEALRRVKEAGLPLERIYNIEVS